ncbi:hypothetical protein ACJDU8_12935 [Clostridium sp. WILCCON 0269]|uniref:Uncharacterized protein n=1 Tax=Candidatus Clostridium eludens TaxID=3381663 RepID=A0ABW8SKL5_9CLOT
MKSSLSLEKCYEEYEECKSELSEEFKKLLIDLSRDEIIYIVKTSLKYIKTN